MAKSNLSEDSNPLRNTFVRSFGAIHRMGHSWLLTIYYSTEYYYSILKIFEIPSFLSNLSSCIKRLENAPKKRLYESVQAAFKSALRE